jgi:NAD(P)-dependent dehydrogenase (short-subunit alcohol dehydrogenase family)
MNKPDFSSIESANKSYGSTWKRYGQGKLANILFTSELQEKLKGENIKVSLRVSPSSSTLVCCEN